MSDINNTHLGKWRRDRTDETPSIRLIAFAVGAVAIGVTLVYGLLFGFLRNQPAAQGGQPFGIPPAPQTGVVTQLAPQATCQGLNGKLNLLFNFVATNPALDQTLKSDLQNGTKVDLQYTLQQLPACSYNVGTGASSKTYTVPARTANVVTTVTKVAPRTGW